MTVLDNLPRRIALFTDFGVGGPYIGQMHSILVDTGLPVIDLLSDAPRFDPRSSAYLLAALADSMPKGTLFLSVVDPGVGGERLPLIVTTSRHWFVGPDNGLFSQVIRREESEVKAVSWRPEKLSNSFHGRDLFAPVACMLCNDEPVPGSMVDPQRIAGADWESDLSRVIYVDHYGNVITGMRAGSLADTDQLQLNGIRVSYARTFSEVKTGSPFWYDNSFGLVEIAVNQGRADSFFALTPGDPIELVTPH